VEIRLLVEGAGLCRGAIIWRTRQVEGQFQVEVQYRNCYPMSFGGDRPSAALIRRACLNQSRAQSRALSLAPYKDDKRGLLPGTDRAPANAGSNALCSFVVQ
jgi:hypothetical protein